MKRQLRDLREILEGGNFTDPAELASALRVSVPTIYSWVRKQTIPFIKLGECVRFDPLELRAWLDHRKVARG